MFALAAEYREVVWHKRNLYLSCHILLDAVHHRLHISHHRVKVHCLVHLLTVPACNLLLPVELTLCEGVLLEEVVCLDDDERCGGLEAYAALDADDGVADVDVASDSERRSHLTDGLDDFHRTHLHSVE